MEDKTKQVSENAGAVDYLAIVNSLPLVVWTANTEGGLTYISRQWETIYGNPLSESLGNGWTKFVHPDDVERAGALWANSLRTGQNYETEFRVQHKSKGYEWILVRALPNYDSDGKITSWNGSNTDINEKKLSEQAAYESEKRSLQSEAKFRALVEKAPVVTALFIGRDLIIELANERVIELWGRGSGVIGKPLAQALPELVGTPFLKILDDVFTTGKTFEAKATFCELIIDGKPKGFYFDFTYQAVRDGSGEIYGILDMAIDVTEQVLAQQKIEKSQQELLASFEKAPVGIATIGRHDLVFRMANAFYGDLVGREPNMLVDKPLLEALPELKGQGFDILLNQVLATGIPYIAKEVAADIVRKDVLEKIYVDLSYQPLKEKGEIGAVLVVATDVTQQVKARKKIEEAEEFLRGAIDLADLGIWTLDLRTRILDYDSRLRNWFGFSSDEIIDVDKAYSPIVAEDRHLIKEAMTHATMQGTNGLYNAEYRITNLKDGSLKIIHAQGKTIYDDNNEPRKVTGTAQDVTNTRNLEIELTKQVQERTEELAASNEELQATNEEIAATNEELEEANLKLQSSNAELEQFAYIASHDLQEPVRKISTFSQMLEKSLGEISDKSKNYIEKINSSTDRMTVLIRDVLAYSQLSGINDQYERVNLNQILEEIKTDYELTIEQKHAVINYSGLPIIEAIPLQMTQLFSNLLSNSLKYSKADVPPQIDITADLITKEEVSEYTTLDHKKSYYRIRFSDNGIGILPEQIDRIFNIFQRLHAKTEYAGTGIGLSICKKIVVNHHGNISAVSNNHQGTTFTIVLPRHFRKRTE